MLFFSVVWTGIVWKAVRILERGVSWLEKQSLFRAGGDTGFPARPSYNENTAPVGVAKKRSPEMSVEEMAVINERIDTQEAHKSATRNENVTVVGEESLCKEETIE